MPTYIYERQDGSTFEIFQRMNDPKLKTCPKTGQPVTRLIIGGHPPQIKNKRMTDYDREKSEYEAKKNKSTSLTDYFSIARDQRKKWEEEQKENK